MGYETDVALRLRDGRTFVLFDPQLASDRRGSPVRQSRSIFASGSGEDLTTGLLTISELFYLESK